VPLISQSFTYHKLWRFIRGSSRTKTCNIFLLLENHRPWSEYKFPRHL